MSHTMRYSPDTSHTVGYVAYYEIHFRHATPSGVHYGYVTHYEIRHTL